MSEEISYLSITRDTLSWHSALFHRRYQPPEEKEQLTYFPPESLRNWPAGSSLSPADYSACRWRPCWWCPCGTRCSPGPSLARTRGARAPAPVWPGARRSSRNDCPGHIPATRSLGLTVGCGRGVLLKWMALYSLNTRNICVTKSNESASMNIRNINEYVIINIINILDCYLNIEYN